MRTCQFEGPKVHALQNPSINALTPYSGGIPRVRQVRMRKRVEVNASTSKYFVSGLGPLKSSHGLMPFESYSVPCEPVGRHPKYETLEKLRAPQYPCPNRK